MKLGPYFVPEIGNIPLSAELKDRTTGERKYLDREERRAFLDATQQQV